MPAATASVMKKHELGNNNLHAEDHFTQKAEHLSLDQASRRARHHHNQVILCLGLQSRFSVGRTPATWGLSYVGVSQSARNL